MTATRPVFNPWTWQDQFGFVQATSASAAQRVLFCAGQASIAPDGTVMHAGDIAAQLRQSFDNLETVLGQAGANLSHVVRLNYYTTDVDALLGTWDVIVDRLAKADAQPTSTLLGVTRLAFPEMLIEIEATALLP
jgi:enamine deaminase RidA (YjgF/YER057c/UK114 family)